MRKIALISLLIILSGSASAESSNEGICISTAQLWAHVMEARKHGKSLLELLNEQDRAFSGHSGADMQDGKTFINKIIIDFYNQPYRDPDKYLSTFINECIKRGKNPPE